MLIVTGTVWPEGNQAASYEVLHATISNNSAPEDATQNYTAHVLARPAPFDGIEGYEADVEVREHSRQAGVVPLIVSTLLAAYAGDPGAGIALPPSRALARVVLQDLAAFEATIRGRS